MDSLSNKVNNDTIKFVNKTYKGLSIINSERFYLPNKNLYDDKIENCIYQLQDILNDMYHASIDKKTSYDMELYDSDSGIPDIQETFEECITPTPREVNKPSTPSAPVKPGKKIIVEEESEEDVEEYEDVVEKEGEHSDVLSHIMGYSDSEESDSDGSYEKISDEKKDDKPVICVYKKGKPYKVQNGFFKNGKPKYIIKYEQGDPIYKKVSANESTNDIEQLSLEEYKKKYPDAIITTLDNGNYKMTHNGTTKELVHTGMSGDHDWGFTDIYSAYPYPYPPHPYPY